MCSALKACIYWGFQSGARGGGIEPARLAAGDFELAVYSVCIGKGGEFECGLIQVKEFMNQSVSVFYRNSVKLVTVPVLYRNLVRSTVRYSRSVALLTATSTAVKHRLGLQLTGRLSPDR